jgi:acetyl esterase/lipase
MNMPSANVLHASQLLRRKTKARRVILLGSSAGANIAALTYQFWPIEFEGFIGFYGVYDLMAKDFSSIVNERIDIYTSNHFDKLQGGSLISRPFPESFLLFHGAEDEHVQLSQSSKMHQRHGGELHVVNGHGHSFNVFGDKDNPAPWMERIVRYCYVG